MCRRPPDRARRGLSPTVLILAALLIALFVKSFILDLAVVDGVSMFPTLKPGQVVLIVRCAYGLRIPSGRGGYLWVWDRPLPGQIVAALSPVDGRAVVKRVAAVGPLRLNLENERLEGDGFSLELPPTQSARDLLRAQGGIAVESGGYFLLGDNPPESLDSRSYGALGLSSISGRVLAFGPGGGSLR